MNYKTIIIFSIFSFLIINISFGKKKADSIESYKKAKNVFVGKIIRIQELDRTLKNDEDYFNIRLAVEFEITKIYKGRRYESFILVEIVAVENKDYLKLKNNYLIYAIKNKSKPNTHYSSIRTRNLMIKETKTELAEIEEHIKNKLFRKEKNPVPKFKFVGGGCNC